MKSAYIVAIILHVQLLNIQVAAQHTSGSHDSLYRPRIHFSPKAHWMNDPNGMVYYKGTYHLFYQYHPYSSVWGPMHWGHATSRNLIHWEHHPVAIYPDSRGTIFSGSAVVDINNSSGFGSKGQVPLVAIFTQHDEKAEKTGKNDFQNQSLAYSLDNGKTWKKYDGNPVLQNPGIRDFRDPKVMWHQPTKKWIMSLAVADRIFFYSSTDLKKWSKESEFGESAGAHGGVWECPDLFSLEYDGKTVWVLIVSLNPGGPNKGSATQYFIGDFDGKKFSPYNTETKWLDYGPDDYAGITWSGTGKRKIFLGWMSNWMYANIVPTESWRSAATLPRELKIKNTGKEMLIASQPVKELSVIRSKPFIRSNISLETPFRLAPNTGPVKFPCLLDIVMDQLRDFSIILSNEAGNELMIGYDRKNNRYFIDRTRSGNTGFHQEFAAIHTAPRFSSSSKMDMTLVIDVSSAELFADDGLTVMTQIFFPHNPFTKITIQSAEGAVIKKLEYSVLKEGR